MIEINLLPQDNLAKASKGKSAGPQQGSLIVAAILFFAFAIVIGLGAYFYLGAVTVQAEASRKMAQAKTLKTELDTKREQFKEISQQLDALRSQVALLSALDPQEGRLFWAEKLNLIPQMVPEGVFLTSIKVTEDVRQKETKESIEAYQKWAKLPKKDRPEAAPKKQFYPEIRYNLSMNGIAYVEDGTDDQLVQLAVLFYNQIKSDPLTIPNTGEKTLFLENFRPNIGVSPMTRTLIDNRPVFQFNFAFESNPTKAASLDLEKL